LKKITIIGILSIIIILCAIYLINARSTTFKEEVPDVAEITSVEIIKTSVDKETVLENGNDVKELLEHWSELELKTDKMGALDFDFDESYWITLKANDIRKYGLTVYDESYFLIYDYSKRSKKDSSRSYKIISGLNLEDIEQYFQ
jgi:ABC-type uncharacterized transport system substrate-binding protein